MKPFRWNPDKNAELLATRGVSFEAMTIAIEDGGLLDVLDHPNPRKYPNQKVFVVERDAYVYLVPFVVDTDHIFLKTVIPSRKATRDHQPDGDPDAQA